MRKIIFVITILLLTSLILSGVNCGGGEPVAGPEEKKIESAEDFYARHCQRHLSTMRAQGVEVTFEQCVQMYVQSEEQGYSECMKTKTEKECNLMVEQLRKTFGN